MTSATSIDRIRHGPILPTLLRLSAPNVVAMALAVLVAIAETFYVGLLGTTPLAALGLVFPFAMLTGTLSAGAMGGGVSSAIARAIGANDMDRAHTLAMHAILIGGAMGIAYSLFFVLGGPALFRWLGGRGGVLDEAVRYAGVLFSGAIFVWMSNTLASVVRGTGNMRVPSIGLVLVGLAQIATGGVLAFGLGPFPALGMVGVALGNIVAYASGTCFFAWYLSSGIGRLRLRPRAFPLRLELLVDILRVGALSCLSPLQTMLTMLVFTSLLARLGEVPLAGYSIGAGDVARARRVAWTAAGVSGAIVAVVGFLVAIWPQLWANMFSEEERVLDYAYQYLRIAGPMFALLCAALTLYFSSQGAGKMLGPVVAGTVRLGVALGVGLVLAAQGSPAWHYFVLTASVMLFYGITMAGLVHLTPWGPKAPQPVPATR
jgi:Na+-driven multidrug efflux pump